MLIGLRTATAGSRAVDDEIRFRQARNGFAIPDIESTVVGMPLYEISNPLTPVPDVVTDPCGFPLDAVSVSP